jgi:hypothetical protein
MPHDNTSLRLVAPNVSPEEAAAIVAALERFTRATAPTASPPATAPDGWHAAALLEGVSRDPWAPAGEAGAWFAAPPG